MEKEIEQSYINEFMKYKDELMSDVNECKDKTKNNLIGCVYGHYKSIKEFWYDKDDSTAFIYVNETFIDVTKYL